MKIVSINAAPTVCETDGVSIRPDVTDIGKILDHVDTCEGRNDRLRKYIYRLRDLQVANNELVYADGGTTEAKMERIDQAQAAVAKAFDRLIIAGIPAQSGSRE